MPCDKVVLPGGGVAIVCSRGPRRKLRCVQCAKPAERLCDWKVERDGLDGAWLTCDAPVCDGCTHQPARDKDLCPKHAAAWRERLAAKAAAA